LADDLAILWKAKLAEEREKAVAARLAEEEMKRADAIDKRAHEIASGWEWVRAKELERAAELSDQAVSAVTPCHNCAAPAIITFVPRTMTVTFACPMDPKHGYERLESHGTGARCQMR
jgi:hypothetical protein